MEKAFLVNEKLCINCGSCRTACKMWNGLPSEKNYALAPNIFTHSLWSRVNTYRDGTSFHEKCRHCFDAVCVKACPEDALYYKNGFVVTDYSKCISCGKCSEVCPYGAVKTGSLEPYGNKAYKCHACVPEPDAVPHCVINCPTEALRFGNRRRIITKALKMLDDYRSQGDNLILEGLTEHGGMGVITLRHDRGDKQISVKHDGRNEKILYRMLVRSNPLLYPVRKHIYGFISRFLA